MPARSYASPLCLLALLVLPGASSAQQPTNLHVLSDTLTRTQVVGIMGGVARALGVRCNHCHVERVENGRTVFDFAADDKPTKRTAREMFRMVQAINETYLAGLASRAEPPVRVQCFTCHRGARRPRTLQDTLQIAYDNGGVDTLVTVYNSLRTTWYGRAAYDFGEVPLADFADVLMFQGAFADAADVHALNVEMNPASAFAKRQHALAALLQAYALSGAAAGEAAHRDLRARYGADVVHEALVNQLGYALLDRDRIPEAVSAFRLNVGDHPDSWNAHDSLGEALARLGDRPAAAASYRRSLELNPDNDNGRRRLEQLQDPGSAP